MLAESFFKGSVYFANIVIAFRSRLPQLHNPMSHEYYILIYSAVFTNLIVNPRSPGHTNLNGESNRSDSNQSHRSKINQSRDENRTQN